MNLPSLDHYFLEGGGYSTDHIRLVRTTNTVDLSTDKANIKTSLLGPVFYQHMSMSGIDHFDSTFFESAEEAILYAATLILELRAQRIVNSLCPATTRSDASAGSCFTRASMEGLISSLERSENIAIPGISLAIANLVSVPIQIEGAIPNAGIPAIYFYPYKPKLTLANIETLIGSIMNEYDGIVHFNRNKLPYYKFSRAMISPPAPVSIVSQYSPFISMGMTVADDAAVTVAEVDETKSLIGFQKYLGGEVLEALAILRAQNAADSPKFWSTVATAAAGKLTLELADAADTGFTAVADTSYSYDWITGVATNQSRTAMFISNRGGTSPMVSYTTPLSVTAWNERLIQYLTRHVNGSGPVILSDPILPDGIARMIRRSGGSSGGDTTNNPSPPNIGPNTPGTPGNKRGNKNVPSLPNGPATFGLSGIGAPDLWNMTLYGSHTHKRDNIPDWLYSGDERPFWER